jgi:hypothetical protein
LNTHRPESSVYLVNALAPANSRIRLGDPRRDIAQHGLTMEYQVMGEAMSRSDRVSALLVLLVMAGFLFWRYGRAGAQGRRAPQAP